MIRRFPTIYVLIFSLVIGGCSSYYQVNQAFNNNFEDGDLDQAKKILENNQKAENSKARFLYFLNLGVVNSMMGNYEESNQYFEQAYLFGEDFRKNYFNYAASLITNPNMMTYAGEDHEHLILLYYKALNYLKLKDHASALVECRRLNNRLQELSDKYTSESKFQRDAFIHNLMGIIYEADKDYNNAFIAYRNALEIYENDYQHMFGLSAPEQLKHDLLRTAYLTGFNDEVAFYEEKFGLKYDHNTSSAQLVFFWNNGLGPVKSEWGLNFGIIRKEGGLVNFVNEEHGFSFPFVLENDEDDDKKNSLSDLEFFRVTFPKYVERPPMYESASLQFNGNNFPLEKAENINAIAFKSLQQRMLKEFSQSLLRLALKKAAEYSAREENDDLGAAIGLINALTEKADTRNWQTIPHSIHYTRIPMSAGQHKVRIVLRNQENNQLNQEHEFTYQLQPEETHFHSFYSLETDPGFSRPFVIY